LLYSAHSLPERYVTEGDPFLKQTQQSVELINAQLNHTHPSTLAFQSRVGPVKWLEPSTRDVLTEMGRRGTDKVLAVPISFVSDHIETLQEIDIAYRELALQSGIKEFRRADSLNLHPKFIDALACIASRTGRF
jgi:ferrochelatase